MFKPAHSVGWCHASSFSCFLPAADLPLCIRAAAKSACCSAGCARASCASAPPVRGTQPVLVAIKSACVRNTPVCIVEELVHAELLSRSNLLPSSGRCEYENCVSSLNAKYRGYSPCVPCIGRWHPPSFPSLLLPPRTAFFYFLFPLHGFSKWTAMTRSRRRLPSFFRSSTSFMRLQLCGERTLPMLPSSRPRIG